MNRSSLQSRLRRSKLLTHALVAVLTVQMALPPQLRAEGVFTGVTVSSTYDGIRVRLRPGSLIPRGIDDAVCPA